MELSSIGLVVCEKCDFATRCIHCGAFRRHPEDVGGLGLCYLLTMEPEQAKLRAEAEYQRNRNYFNKNN